jgi:hypothetical protein
MRRMTVSELDELMDREAKTYTNEDIETIIAYVRKQLALYDAGGKTAKPKVVEELDFNKILQGITGKIQKPAAAPVKKMKRRM